MNKSAGTTPRLYAAYGSNLSIDRMLARCPGATPVGYAVLNDFRLVFRGVADVERCPGSSVPIGIYTITRSDERALDRYEGYRPVNGGRDGLYRKESIPLLWKAEEPVDAMFYAMNHTGYAAPCQSYFDTIVEGYKVWKFDLTGLSEARFRAERFDPELIGTAR